MKRDGLLLILADFIILLVGISYSTVPIFSCLPPWFLFLLSLASYFLKANVDYAEDIHQPNIPFPSLTISAIAASSF